MAQGRACGTMIGGGSSGRRRLASNRPMIEPHLPRALDVVAIERGNAQVDQQQRSCGIDEHRGGNRACENLLVFEQVSGEQFGDHDQHAPCASCYDLMSREAIVAVHSEMKEFRTLLGNFGVPLASTLTIPKKSGRWLVFCIPTSKSDAVHEYGRALQ